VVEATRFISSPTKPEVRWLSSGLLRRLDWYKFTNVSEVLSASIITTISALMMKAVSTSETSVNLYQTTRRNNPENSHLHTRRRENLKSHKQRGFAPCKSFYPLCTNGSIPGGKAAGAYTDNLSLSGPEVWND
jgi:hypothetical protein